MTDAWKFFIMEVTYLIPAEQLGDRLAEHRAFLKTGYEKGWLLMSGPQVPKVGGMLIARAPSKEELEAFFANDPYQVKHIATYRFVEFEPVLRAEIVEGWIKGE